MDSQKMFFLLFFMANVFYQSIKSEDPLVNSKCSTEEGLCNGKPGRPKKNAPECMWKKKVGRPKKNAQAEYFRSTGTQVGNKNVLVGISNSKELMVVKPKELMVVQNGLLNNSASVINASPKRLLTFRSLFRKGIIGALLGFVGEKAIDIVTDFTQKEVLKDTVNDKNMNNKLPINKTSIGKQDVTGREQKQLSFFIDNKISAESKIPVLNKNTSYANDIAFIVLGGVGLISIVGLGYGLYKACQKIKAIYLKYS